MRHARGRLLVPSARIRHVRRMNTLTFSGSEMLDNNRAHQIATAVQYHFSKRTMAYVEAVYQRASGDAQTTQAWINGLLQPGVAASNRSQSLARIGWQTRF